MATHLQKFDSQTLIVPNDDFLAQTSARLIVDAFASLLTRKEQITFIPSSGRTPIKTYQHLANQYRMTIDWSRITLVQMDEYWSQTLEKEAYFHTFLQNHLVSPLGIGRFVSMHKPGSGGLYHPDEYAQILKPLGPVDFALHGIGSNGHIGFNEPGPHDKLQTRIVALADGTRADNFPDRPASDRPKYGMTLGLKDLAAVSHTLLIASGPHKAPAIQRLLNHDSVDNTPACALWSSPDFGLICDQAASDLILR